MGRGWGNAENHPFALAAKAWEGVFPNAWQTLHAMTRFFQADSAPGSELGVAGCRDAICARKESPTAKAERAMPGGSPWGICLGKLPVQMRLVKVAETKNSCLDPGFMSTSRPWQKSKYSASGQWIEKSWKVPTHVPLDVIPGSFLKVARRDDWGEMVFLTASMNEVAFATKGDGEKSLNAEGVLLVRAPFSMTVEFLFEIFGERTQTSKRKR